METLKDVGHDDEENKEDAEVGYEDQGRQGLHLSDPGQSNNWHKENNHPHS